MFYFFLVPESYRKVMFVLRDIHPKTNVSLADYYIRNYGHLIPANVELIEFDERTKEVFRKAIGPLTAKAPPCGGADDPLSRFIG
jgi:hypothetical protein